MNDGYRKAALKLHAMHDTDRQWMLQQLGETERNQIIQLLQELKEIGIESTEDFSEEITADELQNKLLSACEDRMSAEKALNAVRLANAREMADVLSGEPDFVTAAILSMYPWTWRAEFLAEAGIESRLRLSRLLTHSVLKPRVACEMLLIAARRLSEVKKHHSDAMPMYGDYAMSGESRNIAANGGTDPFWKRWRQWLR